MSFIENMLDELVKEQIIEIDEYDLYYYCFDSLFSGIFFYSMILFSAVLLDKIDITIMYYIGFSFIRYTSGGYHASTQIKCFILSFIVYFCSISLISSKLVLMPPEILTGTLLCAAVLIWKFAPVDHPNKRFSAKEKIIYQKKSRIAIVVVIIIVSWSLKSGNIPFAWAIGIGAITATFSVSITYIKRLVK